MKLWKRLVLIFVIVAASSLLAFAHPGNTDSKGGHTDSSTGEYHYHHGYPAHQHTGGVCPYDFDDQTGRNSGTSSTKEANQKPTINKEAAEVKEVPSWVYWIIAGLSLVVICLSLAVRKRNLLIADKDKQLQDKDAAQKEVFHRGLQLEQKDRQIKSLQETIDGQNKRIRSLRVCISDLIGIVEHTQHKPAQEIAAQDSTKQEITSVLSVEGSNISNIKIPDDVYFIDDFVPVIGRTSADKPFGDLTVYTTPSGKCYHSNPRCGSGSLHPAHAYEVIEKKSPCINCAKSFPYSPPEWYRKVKCAANNRIPK